MTSTDIKHFDVSADPADFATLGEGQVAYVKPVRSEELNRLFPQAPQISRVSSSSLFCRPAAPPSCSRIPATWRWRMPGRTTSKR